MYLSEYRLVGNSVEAAAAAVALTCCRKLRFSLARDFHIKFHMIYWKVLRTRRHRSQSTIDGGREVAFFALWPLCLFFFPFSSLAFLRIQTGWSFDDLTALKKLLNHDDPAVVEQASGPVGYFAAGVGGFCLKHSD